MKKELQHLLALLLSDDERNRALGLELLHSQGLQNALLSEVFPATDFIRIEGGSFEMGDDMGEKGDCKPAHTVTLSSFSMQSTPVTQRQYQLIMGQNPSHFRGCGNCPVETIYWSNAIAFCNRLSEWAGLEPVYTLYQQKDEIDARWNQQANGYRLPTEAEWEFAARGGLYSQGYIYAGSNELDEVAWYAANANRRTQPVKGKKPNELGLYDMTGNVWEWCWDRYNWQYYTNSPSHNPTGAAEGLYRVLRGGCFLGSKFDEYDEADTFHLRYRNSFTPHYRYANYGFRLALGAIV